MKYILCTTPNSSTSVLLRQTAGTVDREKIKGYHFKKKLRPQGYTAMIDMGILPSQGSISKEFKGFLLKQI